MTQQNYAHPEALVSTDWVAEHLNDPAVRIIESNEDVLLYDMGHIVGAVHIDWRADLQKVLAGRPLNVVYDPVGGDYAEPALRSLGPDGRFLVVGFATGEIPKVPLNLALLKRCAIIGVNWGGFVAANPNEMRPVLTTLLQWIAEGRLHPAAGETMPLQKAGSAMMKMLNRQAIGKMVVTMNDELKT